MTKSKTIQNSADVEFVVTIGDSEFSVLLVKYPIYDEEFSEGVETIRPIHTHNYYEVVFIQDANSVVFETKDKSIKLKCGDVVINSPVCEHKFYGVEQSNAIKLGFVLNKIKNSNESTYDIFKVWLDDVIYDVLSGSQQLKTLFVSLISSMDTVGAVHRIRACFTNLIFCLYEKFSKSINESFDKRVNCQNNTEDVIANALMFHFATDITAEDVAKQVFLCPKQINRICHKIYGRTFKEQKTHIRIETAKKLLLKTSKTILDVCLECGFNSIGSFYSAFLKLEKIPPNKFRKINNVK